MNDGLKQRIVGASVLVALGIIFVPVIFDKERIVPVDRVSQIPPEPELEVQPLPNAAIAPRAKLPQVQQPIAGEFSAEDRQASLQKRDKTKQPSNTKIESPSVEAKSLVSSSPVPQKAETEQVPQATKNDNLADMWVLQVASYQLEDRAKARRDELIAQGFKAFTRTMQTSKGVHTRLYIGPSLNKAALEKDKRQIDTKYRVDSLLLKFKP